MKQDEINATIEAFNKRIKELTGKERNITIPTRENDNLLSAKEPTMINLMKQTAEQQDDSMIQGSSPRVVNVSTRAKRPSTLVSQPKIVSHAHTSRITMKNDNFKTIEELSQSTIMKLNPIELNQKILLRQSSSMGQQDIKPIKINNIPVDSHAIGNIGPVNSHAIGNIGPVDSHNQIYSDKKETKKQMKLSKIIHDCQAILSNPHLKTKKKKLVASQENSLLKSIPNTKNPQINQIRQKLLIRARKRTLNIDLFDLDLVLQKYTKLRVDNPNPNLRLLTKLENGQIKMLKLPGLSLKETLSKLLVKLLLKKKCENLKKIEYKNSFLKRLNGSPEPFISPFTGKLLPVYIHRDYSSLPTYKRLLNEIRNRILFDVGGLNQQDGWECRNIPIDYVYFQKNDLDQVNTLLCNLFWQIDVSDFLMTPDYCILAKYGKRVIGTVCMLPQGYITYICVANGWNNCGIGKYLLWNCIKIALNGGFDLTLHVQADNDAMILYQEFGFKAEGFIVGFYEKYLPKDSKKCKNALFLRLRIR